MAQGDEGNRGLWSVHNSSSPSLLPPHTFLLVQHRSSRGCSSCQDTLLQHGLSMATAPSGNIQLLHYGLLHELQCRYLLQRGPLHRLQGNACCGVVSSKTSTGRRGIPAPAPGASPPSSSSHDLGVHSFVSHSFFFPLTPHYVCAVFYPFLNMF